ncbi:MAG: DUF4876 domain-containing protein [Rhizobacter sp.]|nr:DUF4876 domain-containing protein [Chlorobiales bacterium]
MKKFYFLFALLFASLTLFSIRAAAQPIDSLVIKQVYYTGSKTPANANYFLDFFIEIYNNSSKTIYLDSLVVADIYGNAGTSSTAIPTPFGSDQNHIYVNTAWMIPGTGLQHPLAPGTGIIIAENAINHIADTNGNPNSPVNLGGANWETYVDVSLNSANRDIDVPTVPNLKNLVFNGGFYWGPWVFGPAMVIFKVSDFAALETGSGLVGTTTITRKKVPNSAVVDVFEALAASDKGGYKRVPVVLDAGFIYASGTYVAQSASRKVAATENGRVILQDTDNSGDDFVMGTPVVPTLAAPEENRATPKGFALAQNYPNPFNPNTVVGYQLTAASQVSLKVFDVLGREVATLVNEKQSAGNYAVNFNAAGFTSGVYFYRLQTGNNVATKKMMLVK